MLNARTLAPEHILNPLQWRVSGNWPNRASVLLSFHFVSWNDWLCRYFNIDCSPSLLNFYELCAGKKEKLLLVTGFHQQKTIFVTNCGWKHTIVKDPNMKNQWLIWPNIYLIADWYLYLLCWEPWLKQAPAATDHCTCPSVVTAPGPGSPVLRSWLWRPPHSMMFKYSRKPPLRMLRRGPQAVSSIPVAVSVARSIIVSDHQTNDVMKTSSESPPAPDSGQPAAAISTTLHGSAV